MHVAPGSLLRVGLLALCLAGESAAADEAAAQAAPPPSEEAESTPAVEPLPAAPPSPVPSPSPDRVFSGRPAAAQASEQEEHSWFDTGRSYVGRLFFSPVVRIDRFFSDLSELDPERGRSFARLRGGVRFRDDGRPVETVDVLADINFPGVDQRLSRFRLVLAGAADSVVDGLASSYGGSAPFSFRDGTRSGNAELRFGAYRGLRSSVDLGAGVLFRLPVGAFTRLRWRLAVPIYDRLVGRVSTSGFWRTDTRFGTRVDGALEWPTDPSTMARLAGSATVAQRKTNGVDYGAELVLSHAFTDTSALALGGDGVGSSGAPVAFDKYRVFARLRHDVLRRWIFVEVEPELGWPWRPDRGRYQAQAITFRLEVQFEADGAAGEAARQRALSAAGPLTPP